MAHPGGIRVNRAQRWLVITALVVLALSSADDCLDYKGYPDYSLGAQLTPIISVGVHHPVIPAHPITLSTFDEFIARYTPTVNGLHPRAGLTPLQAAIGGLAFPFVLLTAAGFLLLGGYTFKPREAFRVISKRLTSVDRANSGSRAEVISCHSPEPEHTNTQRMLGSAGIAAGAVFPMLLILDPPSMMLMSAPRFPCWLFASLILWSPRNEGRV